MLSRTSSRDLLERARVPDVPKRRLNRRRWLPSNTRMLRLEPLEDRRLLAVALNWSGAGGALSLTESASGATPTIIISEPSPNMSLLKVDLGAGHVFAGTSTTSATGLTYQNAGSPTTSQFATIDISLTNNVSVLAATLPGDALTLGPIRDLLGGLDGITASAGTIEVTGIDTYNANGNVDLRATGNLTVNSGATVQTGTGTISLSADVNADGTGNDGVGTLSIAAGATVTSTNPTASAVTLRGKRQHRHQANPAVVGAQRILGTTPSTTLTGLNDSNALAFDGDGNLYVTNYNTEKVVIQSFDTGSATIWANGPFQYLPYSDLPLTGAFNDLNVNLSVGHTVSASGTLTTVTLAVPAGGLQSEIGKTLVLSQSVSGLSH